MQCFFTCSCVSLREWFGLDEAAVKHCLFLPQSTWVRSGWVGRESENYCYPGPGCNSARQNMLINRGYLFVSSEMS